MISERQYCCSCAPRLEITSHGKKYMKTEHILDIQADERRILTIYKSAERRRDFKVAGSVEFIFMQMLLKS